MADVMIEFEKQCLGPSMWLHAHTVYFSFPWQQAAFAGVRRRILDTTALHR